LENKKHYYYYKNYLFLGAGSGQFPQCPVCTQRHQQHQCQRGFQRTDGEWNSQHCGEPRPGLQYTPELQLRADHN